MQLFTALTILAFGAALTAANPIVRAAATCPTTFPSSFKVKEGSGYFKASGTKIINDASEATASYFYINSTFHQSDPATPILSYTARGINYGAWVADSSVGTILLRPTTVLGPNSDIPVIASLQSGCVIYFSLWEAHADSYLQVCSGQVELATSVKTGCTQVTATLVT
ncbi:hypothetical protein LTR91_014096 [Friedmanniomyces endolithicus]|uniref:ML-like domain-containing protein n=1 Tax=Friedmanniomyces endolithicus TaxID=329885 RepID=A0AAN6KCC0_9PEZI|nr:hypothetical protein LTR94_007475 [Friedmanniomyces endolithicus]KAK0782061.1 hypothetical protein LTR75_014497 [Friedmanniomyces endolithicus]KAK0789940.1 hypothetical protein LTR59_009410 [Friedmanniomyces endolithicus]KAK0796151.1 hypothetical protein LTR38_008646 [Friedmanniomyces endolithicus]KAK0865212.1 hypothetical protein LTS02_005528 [Friedmanniomyces endolithicus]